MTAYVNIVVKLKPFKLSLKTAV